MRQEEDLLSDLLISEKQLCSTYSTAVTEAATPNIRTGFQNALSSTFCTQDEVFKAMESKGWYKVDAAETNKITQTKSKFSKSPDSMLS
jgi:spore coat protein CotF